MEIEVQTWRLTGPVAYVSVSGDIDCYTSPEFRAKLFALIDQGKVSLVIDLTGTKFIDSPGLGVFVAALRRVHEKGGRIVLICRFEPILKVFRITGLDRVFPIFKDGEDAAGGMKLKMSSEDEEKIRRFSAMVRKTIPEGKPSEGPVITAEGDEEPVELTTQQEGRKVAIFSVTGDIVCTNRLNFKKELLAQIDEGRVRHVIDLNNVSFIDSSGLGVLVSTLRRLKEEGGGIVLICTKEPILKVFRITGLDRVFRIVRSVDEAKGLLEG